MDEQYEKDKAALIEQLNRFADKYVMTYDQDHFLKRLLVELVEHDEE